MSNIRSKDIFITGGKKLKGEIDIHGAKNSITKLLVASTLTSEKCTFYNVPEIDDLEVTIELCKSIGSNINWIKEKNIIEIQTSKIKTSKIPQRFSGKNRIPILLFGPLLARTKKASIPILGGCKIGARPVDIHFDALKKLGADINCTDDSYDATVDDKFTGNLIELRYPSVGATENAMLAAVLANGKTVIKNAAIEPEITDIVKFLQKIGAIIFTDIDRTIIIEGVEKLQGTEHSALADRIEAASYAVAAAITDGNIFLKNAQQFSLITFLNMFRKAGGGFKVHKKGIEFYRESPLKNLSIETDVYPGFSTDWQQPFVILLTQAKGMSVVHETVYENRFGYTESLSKMGAKIELHNQCLGGKKCRFQHHDYKHSAVIQGPTKLKATELTIPDLRAGFAYVLAALIAEGKSKIVGLDQLYRGYDRIEEKLEKIGADISSK
ncbi:UDP-N-acetylglucosamine 1-carboxyvinyltransferase [Patescibacteria group bacterium]